MPELGSIGPDLTRDRVPARSSRAKLGTFLTAQTVYHPAMSIFGTAAKPAAPADVEVSQPPGSRPSPSSTAGDNITRLQS